jgi:hypothetical protein
MKVIKKPLLDKRVKEMKKASSNKMNCIAQSFKGIRPKI